MAHHQPLASLNDPLTLSPTAPDLTLCVPSTPTGPQLPELPRVSIALNLDADALQAALRDHDALSLPSTVAKSASTSLIPHASSSDGHHHMNGGTEAAGVADAAHSPSSPRPSLASSWSPAAFLRSLSIRSRKSSAAVAPHPHTAYVVHPRSSSQPPSSPSSPVSPVSAKSQQPSLFHQALTGSGWFAPVVEAPSSPKSQQQQDKDEADRLQKLRHGTASRSARRPGLVKRFSSGVSLKAWNGRPVIRED